MDGSEEECGARELSNGTRRGEGGESGEKRDRETAADGQQPDAHH